MKKISVIIFAMILASFSQAQNIVLNAMHVADVEKYEQSLKSEKLVQEGVEEILSSGVYPYAGDHYLTQPHKYKRIVSDFHINPGCDYFFEKNTKHLKYHVTKWQVIMDDDNFDFTAFQKRMDDEIAKKQDYKAFFNKLNKKIIIEHGQPSKRKTKFTNLPETSTKLRYKWIIDDLTITSSLQMPKEGAKGKLIIEYKIYWK